MNEKQKQVKDFNISNGDLLFFILDLRRSAYLRGMYLKLKTSF